MHWCLTQVTHLCGHKGPPFDTIRCPEIATNWSTPTWCGSSQHQSGHRHRRSHCSLPGSWSRPQFPKGRNWCAFLGGFESHLTLELSHDFLGWTCPHHGLILRCTGNRSMAESYRGFTAFLVKSRWKWWKVTQLNCWSPCSQGTKTRNNAS